VILVWDEWKKKTFGRGFNWSQGFRVFRSTPIDSEVEYLLTFFERMWNTAVDFGPTAPF
jgi:hypothetical protein